MTGAWIEPRELVRWMDRQGLGAGPITGAHALGGGTQNILIRFDRGATGFVLRRPPAHPRPQSNETMRREMRVLEALARTAIPHARLLAACPDESVLGVAFYLMEPVEGFNPVAGLPPPYCNRPDWRRSMALAMVEAAAALGNLDHRTIGLEDFGKPEGFIERQTSRWLSQFKGYASFDGWSAAKALPDVERVAEWLERHRPTQFKPGLMHGDFHMANSLFRFDRPALAALVDWELATIGDPVIDLGWLLATWPERSDGSDTPVPIAPWDGFPDSSTLVAHYREHSDRDLHALDWYKVLGCFKLAVLLEGTHARACSGQAPKDVGDRLHAGAARLIARAVRWAQ